MFQDLSSAKYIAIDLETKDLDLRTKGSGALRDGRIMGVAIGTDTGIKEYYSLAHPDSHNIEPEKLFHYLRTELSRKNQPKIGANILYDLEYLAVNNVHVKGQLIDVLIAEPLIDENQQFYNLDNVAKKYLNEGKKGDLLARRCEELGLKGDPRAHIWRFKASDVKEYALGDVDLPIRVFKEQLKIIKREELEQVFSIESRLLPLLLQMKLTGCRIDVQRAHMLVDELTYRQQKLKKKIEDSGLDPSTSDVGRQKMASFFRENNLHIPYTAKTNKPSFTAPYLQTVDKEEIKWIIEYKQLEKFIGTFLKSQILNSLIGDRIHAQFNALRDSEGGTVTGRFSSSRPNLQNIPARNSDLAPRCRSLFIPEEGHVFGSIDYKQIEYRILCHFATGDGSAEVQEAFRKNPDLDIHQWCSEITGVTRDQAKSINFGVIYGQGVKKTAAVLNLSIDEAKDFLMRFNQKMPFLKHIARQAMSRAERRGWVKTILGRRRRFNLFEPAAYSEVKEIPLPYEEAIVKWAAIKRAGTHKTLNAVIQGSSADLLKLAMVLAYEKGLFKILVPLTTVHDELNVSIPKTKEGQEAFKELVNTMQSCYPFRVPIIADAGTGANWSEAK